MTGVGQRCIVIPYYGLGKGDQEGAVFDATGGYGLVVSQGGQVNRDAVMLAARTEQIRVGTGSIKTLP